MTQSPRLEAVLEAFVNAGLGGVWTAYPARVEVVDHNFCTVDAQPFVPRAYTSEEGDRVVENLPMVPGCSVLFQGGALGRLLTPPKVGDFGILLFTSCALDTLLGTGTMADPVADRRNTLTDAVFIHGFHHWNPGAPGGPPTEYDDENVVLHAVNLLKLGGKDAAESLVLGTTFINLLEDFLAEFKTWASAVATATGVSAVTVNDKATAIQNGTTLSGRVVTE